MRQLLLLLFIGSCHFAIGQEFLPLPTAEVEWTRLHSIFGSTSAEPAPSSYHYVPLGDTLIGNQVYTTLYVSGGKFFQEDDATYAGSYYSDGPQTWYWRAGATAPKLIMDISLLPGDTLKNIEIDCESWHDCPVFTVASLDTIYTEDGVSRRKLNINIHIESESRYAFSWMEGIGSTLGLFNEMECLQQSFLTIEPQCEWSLLCFAQSGQLLYTDPIHYDGSCYVDGDPIGSTTNLDRAPIFNLYPNPAHHSITIEMLGVSGVAIQPYRIFSSTGQLFATGDIQGQNYLLDISSFPPGVYTIILPQRNSMSIGRFTKL